MKKLLPALFLASAVSAPALAGEVDATSVNTFEAGTPALAAEVNDNFAALISAINDNATRIAALEDTVPDSIAGSWSVVGLEMEMAGNTGPDTYSELVLAGTSGSFQFDPAGTFSGSIDANQVKLSTDRICEADPEGVNPDECYSTFEPATATPNQALSGTWTDNGSNLTLDLGGETLTVLKGSDDLLILGVSDLITTEPVGAAAQLVFLVRD